MGNSASKTYTLGEITDLMAAPLAQAKKEKDVERALFLFCDLVIAALKDAQERQTK